MRLLVPMRISLALRMATSRPVSSGGVAASTRSVSKQRSRPAAAVVVSTTTPPPTSELLQQLRDMSKLSTVEPNAATMRDLKEIAAGNLHEGREACMPGIIKALSDANDFASIGNLLDGHARAIWDRDKVPIKEALNHQMEKNRISNIFRAVNEVLWAGSCARSFNCLPPSLLNWLEIAVRHLPEPVPIQKESMLWLLSIIRSDLPMLQQLQQESSSKGSVGPEIEREKTLRHVALTYLEAGNNEEFRSLWTSSGTPILDEEHELYQPAAILHHALLRRNGSGKPDPAMLRWYAESLVANQQTPIPEKPQFETMMVPMIKNLGGKIEKWRSTDWRLQKLRKWRDDYDDSELDNLRDLLLDYLRQQIITNKYGKIDDLNRLLGMLARMNKREEDRRKGGTVVVDWLNFIGCNIFRGKETIYPNIAHLFPSCALVVVGRERLPVGDWTPRSPAENERIKVMEVTKKKERLQEVDDLCAIILAVDSRGYLLTNDKTRPHVHSFFHFLKEESKDVSLSLLLKNYLNDAVLRHQNGRIQPAVDHSKRAQWIDKNKKELAFTVARKASDLNADTPFRVIDYYSLHID